MPYLTSQRDPPSFGPLGILSPLLDESVAEEGVLSGTEQRRTEISIGFTGFHFRPDGSTNLDEDFRARFPGRSASGATTGRTESASWSMNPSADRCGFIAHNQAPEGADTERTRETQANFRDVSERTRKALAKNH